MKKTFYTYLFLLIAIGAVILTEPRVMDLFEIKLYGSIVAIVNVTAFWYIGFVTVVVLPDPYLDRVFGLNDHDSDNHQGVTTSSNEQSMNSIANGLLSIGRALIIIALAGMYSTLVYIFFGG